MEWSLIGFGKYATNTLPQVLFRHPNWFFSALDDGVFDRYPELLAEARVLAVRARRVRLPPRHGSAQRAEFIVLRGVVWDVRPAMAGEPRNSSSVRFSWRGEIDMSFPWQVNRDDKFGAERMLRCLKLCLFGDEKKRISKRAAEEFFRSLNNFAS